MSAHASTAPAVALYCLLRALVTGGAVTEASAADRFFVDISLVVAAVGAAGLILGTVASL